MYEFERKTSPNLAVDPNDQVESSRSERTRIICFQRSEIQFNNKKSIVINVRDLTNQRGLFESKTYITQLNQAIERLSNELEGPISIVNSSADRLLAKFNKILEIPPVIKSDFDKVINYSSLASLKAKSFKDFGKISSRAKILMNVVELDVDKMTRTVIESIS